MVKCTFCSKEAFYLRPYSGERFCRKCYVKSIERNVQRTISKYKMLKPNDRVAVAVSGGKDSLSLLNILNKIEEKFPNSELTAITIDEGISNYRSEAIEIADEHCEKLGIELHVYTFKELYGYGLDEVVEAAEAGGELTPCSYCGILRRRALNLAAKDTGATKLATAHNLDDETQSMVMNILRGAIYQMGRIGPISEKDTGFVQRVKPLCQVPEKEVALYASLNSIRFQTASCPYSETSMRSDIRRFLNYLENKHPGMKFSIFQTFEKIRANLGGLELKHDLNRCEICNEPTSGKICRPCSIIASLGLQVKKPEKAEAAS